MKQTRNTMQREVVMEALGKIALSHPTAQAIYDEVIKTHPHISKGTVYRNLGILTDQGHIVRVSMGDGVDRYDMNTSFHGHLICHQCKRLFDITMSQAIDVSSLIESGFQVDSQAVILQGLCPDCIQLNKNEMEDYENELKRY